MPIFDIDYKIAYFSNFLLNKVGVILTPILKFITTLGNYGFIFIFISIIMLLFKNTRKAGINALIAMFIGIIIVFLLKNVIRRDRPFVDVYSDFNLWWKASGSIRESGFSFPSGHTTSSMAFAFVLFISFDKKYSWLFLFIPLLMGFSRIYFMLHYFTDVIGGIIIGIISAIIAIVLFKLLLKINFINKIYSLPSIVKRK